MSAIKPNGSPFVRHLMGAFLIAGTCLLHAQNLVTNGGFESGTTGWSNNTSGGAIASFSLETSLPYAGEKAMKIAVTNPSTQLHNVQTLGPTFTLAVGTSTSITFRARASTAGVKVRFVMQNNTYHNKEFTLSTAWQWFTWIHTTTEAGPRLRIQYRSAGTVRLDEISVVENPAPGTTTRISSDPTIRHQMMDGIGGSIAFNLPDYAALSATQKTEIENLLYVDCGIDIVRLRTGNSDALNNELAMRAQRNGAKSLLTSWSPPASLKSNNSTVSGTLRIVSGKYDYSGFADWWYTSLNASNWNHDFISIQNEPSYEPGDKETCRFFANETVPATTSGSASYKLALEAVYNRIKNETKKPQFIAVDAETHSAFNSIAPTVSGLSYVNYLGFHNYGTNDFAGVEARYNGKRGWMTEWGKDGSATDPIGIKENWLLLATNIHETLVGANASAYLAWRMVHGNNTGQVWAMIGVENGQYVISLRFPGLPVASATAFRTRQFDIGGFPYQSLGTVNIANDQAISKNSITTFVINLAETLNPYDPALLRVDGAAYDNNQFSLSIPAQSGHDFILWKSTTLAADSWQKVTNAVFTESNGQLILTDPTGGATRAFYRVERDTGL